MKCITNPTIAASIRLSNIFHATKNPTNDGMLIIRAITEPFANNSVFELFLGLFSSVKLQLDQLKVIKI